VLRSRGLRRHARLGIGDGLREQPDGADGLRFDGGAAADEDAIEFILFDLSSCITPAGYTPMNPAPEAGTIQ
jgi:hypothetical protein